MAQLGDLLNQENREKISQKYPSASLVFTKLQQYRECANQHTKHLPPPDMCQKCIEVFSHPECLVIRHASNSFLYKGEENKTHRALVYRVINNTCYILKGTSREKKLQRPDYVFTLNKEDFGLEKNTYFGFLKDSFLLSEFKKFKFSLNLKWPKHDGEYYAQIVYRNLCERRCLEEGHVMGQSR